MPRKLLFFLTIVFPLVATEVADICTMNKIVNGCSVPGHLPVPYQKEFLPSCNRHDICYECGIVYGVPRYICDLQFYNDMENQCVTKHRSNFKKDACLMGAQMYYKTVEMFGRSHWNSMFNGYCKMPWVPMCLPPMFTSPLQAALRGGRHHDQLAGNDVNSGKSSAGGNHLKSNALRTLVGK